MKLSTVILQGIGRDSGNDPGRDTTEAPWWSLQTT